LAYSLGLPRPNIKSHTQEKVGGFGLGELVKILGFPYNISATAGASDFKFTMHLEFVKAHHKTTPRGKVGMALGYGSSQIFGVLL